MAMRGFTVLVTLALLPALAPAARAPLEVSLEDGDQSSAVRLEDADAQSSALARQEGAQLQNGTAAGPEGWVHRKVREAWGQGDLPGRVLQAAARHVSAGVSMLQDTERLSIATSGISVLEQGAGRLGHLLKLGQGTPPVQAEKAAPPTAAAGGLAVSTKGDTTGGLEEEVEHEVEKDLGASAEQVKAAKKDAQESMGGTMGMQCLFALLYFFFIASKYPKLPENAPISEEVSEFYKKSELSVPFEGSPNVFLACCCYVARAAHTMDATGTLGYWPSCVLMTLFPCPTLWLVQWQSDMRSKLGAAPRGCFMDLLCVAFCSCCVIAQDAIALDMITGASTGICGVTDPPPAAPVGPEPVAAPAPEAAQ